MCVLAVSIQSPTKLAANRRIGMEVKGSALKY